MALTEKGIDPRVFSGLSDKAIFGVVRDASPDGISRADMARATGFSKPTISAVVSDFEEAGLLRAAEASPAGSIGRPATKYKIVPEAGFVVAVDMGATKTLLAVADLLGNIVREEKFSTGGNAEEAIDRIADRATAMVSQMKGQAGSVCIGVPGVYQSDTDRVEQAVNLPGFEKIAVKARLAERLGIDDIQIENDVNLAAAAESEAVGRSDVVAISIGTGIGLGIVIGGNLYRGNSGAAGEIGSLWLVPPQLNGQGPTNVEPMTVEDVASGPSISNLLKASIEDGLETALDPDAEVEAILAASVNGDIAARHAVGKAADAMALAVAHLSMIFDPEHVVFGGGVGKNPIMLEAVRERVVRLVPYPPPMTASVMGGRATLLGAVSVALSSLHEKLITRQPQGVAR